MKLRSKIIVALVGGSLAVGALAGPARAHHSHAMFDDAREVTVTGTVTAVRFANPHVYVMINGAPEGEEARMWAIEMSHIGNMNARGVYADTFQKGLDVTITVNPLRNGQAGGNYTHIDSINGVTNTAEGNAWSDQPPEPAAPAP